MPVFGCFDVTYFFPSSLVIGRGGEQISRLQQESGCKIQIAPGRFRFVADTGISNVNNVGFGFNCLELEY